MAAMQQHCHEWDWTNDVACPRQQQQQQQQELVLAAGHDAEQVFSNAAERSSAVSAAASCPM
jgi:hypothetical protein